MTDLPSVLPRGVTAVFHICCQIRLLLSFGFSSLVMPCLGFRALITVLSHSFFMSDGQAARELMRGNPFLVSGL